MKKKLLFFGLLVVAAILIASIAAAVVSAASAFDKYKEARAQEPVSEEKSGDSDVEGTSVGIIMPDTDYEAPQIGEYPESQGSDATDEPDFPPDEEPDEIYPDALTVSVDVIDSDYTVKVPHAALYDMTDDILIMTTGLFDRIYPASTTKVMTALYSMTVVEPDALITVGDEITLIASDSSTAGLRKGQIYTFEQLLYAMLMRSGNDAAYTIATYCGRSIADNPDLEASDAVGVFMERMNAYIDAVGMLDTNFVAPDGYHDPDHYTTLYDVLIMSKLALQNEALVRITSTYTYSTTIVSGDKVSYTNTNSLLYEGNGYGVSRVIGLKTGYTRAAGYCLIAAAEGDDGHIYVALIYGAEKSRRYTTASQLLRYGMG